MAGRRVGFQLCVMIPIKQTNRIAQQARPGLAHRCRELTARRQVSARHRGSAGCPRSSKCSACITDTLVTSCKDVVLRGKRAVTGTMWTATEMTTTITRPRGATAATTWTDRNSNNNNNSKNNILNGLQMWFLTRINN
jgi:hypothetical protein